MTYYCHFEERERPAEDFSMYIKERDNTDSCYLRNRKERYIPRAICNECLKAGRSLGQKFDVNGHTKKEYEFPLAFPGLV